MSLASSCSFICPSYWCQVLSREWRCCWSSADRRCSNYIWVIDKSIAHQGASYIRDLMVYFNFLSVPDTENKQKVEIFPNNFLKWIRQWLIYLTLFISYLLMPGSLHPQGLHSISHKMSYCQILQSLEATTYGFIVIRSFWNLPGALIWQ